jgi:hypothetical protein
MYDMRPDQVGWTVHDVETGKPAALDEVLLTELEHETADELVGLLNRNVYGSRQERLSSDPANGFRWRSAQKKVTRCPALTLVWRSSPTAFRASTCSTYAQPLHRCLPPLHLPERTPLQDPSSSREDLGSCRKLQSVTMMFKTLPCV